MKSGLILSEVVFSPTGFALDISLNLIGLLTFFGSSFLGAMVLNFKPPLGAGVFGGLLGAGGVGFPPESIYLQRTDVLPIAIGLGKRPDTISLYNFVF